MTPRIIEVVVSPKGETHVQTKGFAGGECQQATKFLEEALGLSTNDLKTAEFYTSDRDPAPATQPVATVLSAADI